MRRHRIGVKWQQQQRSAQTQTACINSGVAYGNGGGVISTNSIISRKISKRKRRRHRSESLGSGAAMAIIKHRAYRKSGNQAAMYGVMAAAINIVAA